MSDLTIFVFLYLPVFSLGIIVANLGNVSSRRLNNSPLWGLGIYYSGQDACLTYTGIKVQFVIPHGFISTTGVILVPWHCSQHCLIGGVLPAVTSRASLSLAWKAAL